MTSLKNLSVLIIDPNGEMAFDLRQSLTAAEAATHVVANFASAEKLLDAKTIDAVILPYSQDPQTVAFCRAISDRNIPSVFTSEPPARYSAKRRMSSAIIAVKGLIAEQCAQTHRAVH
jgi:DNA-binding NtrC family response regulator